MSRNSIHTKQLNGGTRQTSVGSEREFFLIYRCFFMMCYTTTFDYKGVGCMEDQIQFYLFFMGCRFVVGMYNWLNNWIYRSDIVSHSSIDKVTPNRTINMRSSYSSRRCRAIFTMVLSLRQLYKHDTSWYDQTDSRYFLREHIRAS
jgi:hypothetical protein